MFVKICGFSTIAQNLILLVRFEVVWIKELGKRGKVAVALFLGLHVHPT